MSDTPNLEIHILDAIDACWGISAADIVPAIAKAPEGTHIDLYVNSPGGDLFEAVAILNALRRHSGDINAHVLGLAASAASVIVSSPDFHVTAYEGSFIMIHEPYAIAMGTSEDMRNAANRLDTFTSELAMMYSRRTGKEVGDVIELMERETWWNGAEAHAAGLVDTYVESSKATNYATSSRAGGDRMVESFRNMPEEARALWNRRSKNVDKYDNILEDCLYGLQDELQGALNER